jgi:hypothetical protein
MGLGSYFGGLRVTEILAEKVTKMNHAEGLSANLTTSTLVLASGSLIACLDHSYQQLGHYRNRSSHMLGDRALDNCARYGPGLGGDAAGVGSLRMYGLPHPHQSALAGC